MAAFVALASIQLPVQAQGKERAVKHPTFYRTTRIDGLSIFYREALAWVHGAGMILTPVLGEMAYQQRKRGESVHGIASAHGAAAVTTVVAYAAAIFTESLR